MRVPRTQLRVDEPLCILHDPRAATSPHGVRMRRSPQHAQLVELFLAEAGAAEAVDSGILRVFTPAVLAHCWMRALSTEINRIQLPAFTLTELTASIFAPLGSVTVRWAKDEARDELPVQWTGSVLALYDRLSEDNMLRVSQRALWAHTDLQRFRAAWEYDAPDGLAAVMREFGRLSKEEAAERLPVGSADAYWVREGLALRCAMEQSRLIEQPPLARDMAARAEAARDARLTGDDPTEAIARAMRDIREQSGEPAKSQWDENESDDLPSLEQRPSMDPVGDGLAWGPPRTAGSGAEAAARDTAYARRWGPFALTPAEASALLAEIDTHEKVLLRAYPNLPLDRARTWLRDEFPELRAASRGR
jgi:hypothetical protein